MFHAALLHLMRVAAPTQTTFTISLKRSAATLAAGRASQPNTPSKQLDDANIWDLMGRVRYASHWKSQHDEIDSAIKKLGASVLGEKDFVQFKLMQDFVNHVGDVLATFGNIVQPRSFDDLVKYGFDNPPEPETAK